MDTNEGIYFYLGKGDPSISVYRVDLFHGTNIGCCAKVQTKVEIPNSLPDLLHRGKDTSSWAKTKKYNYAFVVNMYDVYEVKRLQMEYMHTLLGAYTCILGIPNYH